MPAALALSMVDEPAHAAVLLKPELRRLVDLLSTPNSAAGLARDLGWSRQVVNYHLKELKGAGLIVLKEERKRGNCMERVMQRAAAFYVINPQTLGSLAADPERMPDKFSSAYLVAVAARTIKDISRLNRETDAAGKTLPTLTLETEVRFRSAQERSAFTAELTAFTTELVRKYNDSKSPNGRSFRIITAAYPETKK